MPGTLFLIAVSITVDPTSPSTVRPGPSDSRYVILTIARSLKTKSAPKGAATRVLRAGTGRLYNGSARNEQIRKTGAKPDGGSARSDRGESVRAQQVGDESARLFDRCGQPGKGAADVHVTRRAHELDRLRGPRHVGSPDGPRRALQRVSQGRQGFGRGRLH